MEFRRRFFCKCLCMNVLVVCNKFPFPPTDGGQIATFAMIRGMAEQGHSVIVAAINTKKHFYDVSNMPNSVRKLADFRTVFCNTDVTLWGTIANILFSRLPYTATRFIFKEFSDLLRTIFVEKQFDVVQLEGLYMCAYIPLIRECSKAKIAYRAHNVEFEIWNRLAVETKNAAKRLYLKNLSKRVERFEIAMLNQYDYLIPITQRDGETYNRLGNTKPQFVASTGIFVDDLPQFNIPQEQAVSLFHIGALDWTPNQQGLLWFITNCWQKIRQQNSNIQLFIAGRNAPQWFVEQLLVDGVVYVGEVPDAHEYMSQHTIMIVPLLAGGGMRIKILEGLSYGKVIVSTSIGAEGIPAESGREICIADSAEMFVEAINQLVQSPIDIQRIGNQAVEFVRKTFDNRKCIQQLLDFYQAES